MLILSTRISPKIYRISLNNHRNFVAKNPTGCGSSFLQSKIGGRTTRLVIREYYQLNSNSINRQFIGKLQNIIGRNGLAAKRLSSSKKLVTEAQKVRSSKTSDFRRLLSLARSEKWIFIASLGCLIVSSSITMAVPYSIGKVLDLIFTETGFSKEKLTAFCGMLIGVFVIGAVANFGRIYLMNGASLRIIRDVREKLYRTMMNQEAGWFDTKGTGELVNRLSTDTYIVGNSLSQNLSDGCRSLITIVAGTAMMFYTSSELAVVSLGIVPCIGGLAIVYGRYVKKITKQLLDQYAEIMKTAEERLNNIKTVKIFCKEEYENRLFASQLVGALNLGYKDVLARASFYGLTGFSGNVIVISVLYYGGSLVAQNEITIGALTSFILYAGFTAMSIGGVGNFYTEINKGIGAASRIWDIFDRKHQIPVGGGLVPNKKPLGEIIFKDVVFSFPTRPTQPIIDCINLTIKPGTVTAIVGRSGSGKTALATMLLRLYDPQSGTISLDGIDLKDLNPTWLRRHIGAVNQEPILFSGTIRENILYGINQDDSIEDGDFERAACEAHVDEFVRKLSSGYETLVGQRGMMLSGGQKQRVAIARALIRNPSILILDEATSALDAVSENLVQKAIENISQGRTVLTIAHRLSTIRNAQNIVVLDAGRIAEVGGYDELMRRPDGVFKSLVEKQTFEQPPPRIESVTSHSDVTAS